MDFSPGMFVLIPSSIFVFTFGVYAVLNLLFYDTPFGEVISIPYDRTYEKDAHDELDKISRKGGRKTKRKNTVRFFSKITKLILST